MRRRTTHRKKWLNSNFAVDERGPLAPSLFEIEVRGCASLSPRDRVNKFANTVRHFRGGVRRSTVMHLSSRKPGLTHSLVSPVVRIRIMDLTGMGAMVLNWFVESEEVFMLQMVSQLILKLSLFLVTAVATHLVMSFGQTLLHYKVAHNPIGGKLFRNHINFHHTHYAEDHLVSRKKCRRQRPRRSFGKIRRGPCARALYLLIWGSGS
jgi:hypothetical protein